MKGVCASLLMIWTCGLALAAQERSRSVERIALALQQPAPIVSSTPPVAGTGPTTFGIFTLVTPEATGEVIRVAVPIGELLSRAFKTAAAVKHRHEEAAARREVAAALKWFEGQRPAPQR